MIYIVHSARPRLGVPGEGYDIVCIRLRIKPSIINCFVSPEKRLYDKFCSNNNYVVSAFEMITSTYIITAEIYVRKSMYPEFSSSRNHEIFKFVSFENAYRSDKKRKPKTPTNVICLRCLIMN